jgi:hypothetical protein
MFGDSSPTSRCKDVYCAFAIAWGKDDVYD